MHQIAYLSDCYFYTFIHKINKLIVFLPEERTDALHLLLVECLLIPLFIRTTLRYAVESAKP